jgi:hypothetical protein
MSKPKPSLRLFVLDGSDGEYSSWLMGFIAARLRDVPEMIRSPESYPIRPELVDTRHHHVGPDLGKKKWRVHERSIIFGSGHPHGVFRLIAQTETTEKKPAVLFLEFTGE